MIFPVTLQRLWSMEKALEKVHIFWEISRQKSLTTDTRDFRSMISLERTAEGTNRRLSWQRPIINILRCSIYARFNAAFPSS